MRKIIFLLLALSQLNVVGQRLNFGISFNFLGLYYTHIKEDIVFAKHSYRAYYVNKNQFSYASSFQYNFLTNIDYGRYTFTAELGYFAQSDGLKTKLSYPIANNEFYNYYSKVSYSGYSLSPIVSCVLTNRRIFRLYVEAGLPYMLLNESLVNEKITGSGKNSGYWSNQDEMISQLGLKHDYFNILLGIGYRMSIFSFSLRYINKINSESDPDNNLGYFTLNLSTYTNFSKLKKHYIYIE